ncbi:hypothetical protein Bequi_02675 [Brachybacterium sp. JHP9]|uniref:DUF2516 domain-containing protein n=1 Tax=Brachybacterium equifaecis TaxID=2910770 RepID=A0ABT0QXI9_9MICO|nr:hypothetical protein [Brachybacterium equifaecis]MCL6422300.1 hypothetical protein [Brachybacterium equifaecis]
MSIDLAEIALNTVKVLVVGLLLGAGLPLLFSLGIRLQDIGHGGTGPDGVARAPQPAAKAGAWVIFAAVGLVVLYGLLFITKKSIAHYLGIELPI